MWSAIACDKTVKSCNVFVQALEDGKKATYTFEDVMPGKYRGMCIVYEN